MESVGAGVLCCFHLLVYSCHLMCSPQYLPPLPTCKCLTGLCHLICTPCVSLSSPCPRYRKQVVNIIDEVLQWSPQMIAGSVTANSTANSFNSSGAHDAGNRSAAGNGTASGSSGFTEGSDGTKGESGKTKGSKRAEGSAAEDSRGKAGKGKENEAPDGDL